MQGPTRVSVGSQKRASPSFALDVSRVPETPGEDAAEEGGLPKGTYRGCAAAGQAVAKAAVREGSIGMSRARRAAAEEVGRSKR